MKYRYTAKERRAEKEIDQFLRSVNGAPALDVMEELRQLSA